MVELVRLDFLVEIVVVLRADGGGGCEFLGLPLVVVELGGVAGFEEQKRKNTRVAAMIFCVVSVYGSILAEGEVKN